MQITNVSKISMVVLLSVFMTACSSSNTDGAATEAGAGSGANASGAGNQTQLSQAELERQAALAKKVFYFEFDRSDLSAEDRAALVHHADNLKANPNMRIRLEGHADERGTREYNLALGERRSQAVERYLQVQGVSANQMEIISYGEEMPADTATTEAAYSRNRRVEMK